jgi:hypothetical protein
LYRSTDKDTLTAPLSMMSAMDYASTSGRYETEERYRHGDHEQQRLNAFEQDGTALVDTYLESRESSVYSGNCKPSQFIQGYVVMAIRLPALVSRTHCQCQNKLASPFISKETNEYYSYFDNHRRVARNIHTVRLMSGSVFLW